MLWKKLKQWWWELIGNCWEDKSSDIEKVNLQVTFKTSVFSSEENLSGKWLDDFLNGMRWLFWGNEFTFTRRWQISGQFKEGFLDKVKIVLKRNIPRDIIWKASGLF